MIFTKFKLLMWKNVRLRRYHWIVTLIEFSLPILVAYLLTRVRSSLAKTDTKKVPAQIFSSTSSEILLALSLNLGNETKLYYAPSNRAIDGFMDSVIDYFDGSREFVVGYANEVELENALSKESKNINRPVGIFFKNIESKDSLPNKLSYVLRDTSEGLTRSLYPPFEFPGPLLDDFFYIMNRYAAIQLILNENFIKIKTNRNELPKLEFEPFPYPEYVMDKGVPREVASLVVGVFVTLTVLILSIPLINDIIEEKDSGVKELMKISGLDEWMIWSGWFVHAIVVSLISFPIVTWILTHPFKGSGSEAIHFVQYSILLAFIILYCIANVSFCFMFSSMFHKAGIASSMFVICFGLFFSGIGYLASHDADKLIMKLCAITPIGAFIIGFGNIKYYEIQGIEFTWSSIALSENNDRISLLFCMGMLVFDTFLYLFLTYYITSVNPGKFGVRKSPFFIFQLLFSFLEKDDPPSRLRNSPEETNSQFFESSPSNLEATIRINNLHKQFGAVHAVNGVNLNIYRGEMTALLGHNGAGKTTTMAIMTGLTSPTSGSIHFKNMDIFENMGTFRRHLGMCPQENRTMPYLSVTDHLLFFGQLKGISLKEAKIEANEYLTMMELQSKKNSLAKELSGGMKRKLCLSIALMGKAQVLILDEPTSGMDVQSRRKLWDLLLDLRGKRTIIFTTHYMEEADALGDRIAIMNHGQIVCHGTPIFLKKAYGTGYELTITKTNGNVRGVDPIIKNLLPSAKIEFESSTELVYKLPLTETDKFPTLFKNLESGMTDLGIKDMGIAATTMEQVFLKVGGISSHDVKSPKSATTAYTNGKSKNVSYSKGMSLIVQQMMILLKKKFWFTVRNPFTIITRIIMPTFIGLFMLSLLPDSEVDYSPEPSLDFSLSTYPGSTVVMKNNGDTSGFEKYLTEYVAEKGGILIKSEKPKVEDELLEQASDIFMYNKNYISGFEFSPANVKLLSNPKLIHSLPITITTYSNVLLRSLSGNNLYQIETSSHPVPKSDLEDNDKPCGYTKLYNLTLLAFYFLWFCAAAFCTVDLTSYFSTFLNMERIDGFYHIQMMSNVSPFLYWTCTLVFDLSFFFIIVIVRVSIYKIIDHSKFLGLDTSLGVLALIIFLYGIGGLLFISTTGYLSNSKEGSYTLLFVFNLICGIAVSIYYQIDVHELYKDWWLLLKMLFHVSKVVILFVPSLNFSLLFIQLMVIFKWNTNCQYCSEALKAKCEAKFPQKSFLEFPSKENPDGLMLGITFLLIDIVFYAVLLSLINMGYIRCWFDALKNFIFGTETTNNDKGDDDVRQEFQKVQLCKKNASKRNGAALLADGLRKNYLNWFKQFTAVSNVNFVVEPGECFGLLGVNGAGKSTTFKMLTGEIQTTLGDSSIEGIKISSNKKRYLSMAGYCPQTNCFMEVLTGKEMLFMIAAMRGVPSSENQNLVNRWITIMGLEEFKNKKCGTYSGGNKRKLCTAMSLIGDPRVVFLDEPTSGVDPVSRRSLYDVMGRSKEAGQAVILTSHSMEECETLCDRITIMVAGVMKCIGTAQHLKKSYAQGFSILIKIYDIPEIGSHVSTLKSNMAQAFSSRGCILKDEHRGLLYYQIKDTTLPWSRLFEKMEALKYLHQKLVEDYVLTDTTLEEVFMSFAKESATKL